MELNLGPELDLELGTVLELDPTSPNVTLTLFPTMNFLVPPPPRMPGEEDVEAWRMQDACILGGGGRWGIFDWKSVTLNWLPCTDHKHSEAAVLKIGPCVDVGLSSF